MNLIILVVLAALAVIAFIKLTEMKHKILLKVILVLGVFIVGTLGYVYFKNQIDISTYEGFVSLGHVYLSWLGSLANNIKSVTGYAINQVWGLNSTASP